MNKKIALISALLALTLAWVGCHKADKLTQPSAFKPPTGPVELKLKWTAGERIQQQMTMTMENDLILPGQKEPTKQEMEIGQAYNLAVLKDTPDGGHELEMEFLSARMGMSMGGNVMMNYDSSHPAAGGKTDPGADMFVKMVGSKIRFFLDATNGVTRLEGAEELMARMTSGQQPAALAAIKGMFSPEYFKQMMSANRFLPSHPVSANDTWPAHLEMSMASVGDMVMDYTITFQDWEMHGQRNCARLEFQGTIQTKPGSGSALPGGVTISSMDGTSAGVSWFDPELGLTIDTSMNQDMQMVMGISIPLQKGSPPSHQSITNTIKQTVTTKLVSVK